MSAVKQQKNTEFNGRIAKMFSIINRKSPCIMDLVICPAISLPADSTEEPKNLVSLFVRSNSLISCGFKSRLGGCPFTPVAQGSGVLATGGREFPIGKAAGRSNASEPVRSLVKVN
jgi:hypothetical protein